MFLLRSITSNKSGVSNMTTQEVAEAFTALCKAGQMDEAGTQFWAENVRSIENMEGPNSVAEGIPALIAKGEWWYGAHEVHSVETHGPYVNGNQFAVRFVMDITNKESGERVAMDEIALYTVESGKISEERFYY
jgi:ketosteroid isomerase-like protein